ncbi:stress enhanced protein 1, chloroplastic-like [Musa acuminata AAA Group]|uniref:stress enhanced protein 1, chloroplastic-like n=1 Tax=Musa acuminata AAA Group TaxID=214697 RepID=UPI0031E3EAC9
MYEEFHSAAAARALLVASSPVFLSPSYAAASASKPFIIPRFSPSGASPLVSSFTRAFPSVIWITSRRRKVNLQRTSVSIRCEQGTKENNGLDVWLGRFAMVGFATAITVEISTGKGLLENFRFIIPQPTLAFMVTTLVDALSVFFFQSASQD